MLHVLYKYVERRHGILPFYRTTNNMLMPFRVGEKKVDVISCHGTNFLSGETG
jgi:hypothetical protein